MAIEPIYNHYIIDMSSNNNFVQIPTMQGDGNTVRGFEIEFISNGIQYIVNKENTIVSIAGSKPDTKHILNECTVTDEGYILVDITSQMSAVKGRGDYCIVLMDKNTNSQLKSFPFYILTTSAPFNISEIISSDEFQLLTKRIIETEGVVKEGTEVIQDMRDLESEVTSNETKRVQAENERDDAENIRQEAESIRQTNEVNRENAFDDLMEIANAEVERLQKENDTASASAELAKQYEESAKISAENATKEASNAAVSATNASKSEVNAATSENNAKTSETNASLSASSAKTNADTATNQATIATNAANSALEIEGKVTIKAEEAHNYSNLSKSYAIGTENVIRENDSVDNAKYYYEQARGISEGLNGTLMPMGTILFANLESQTKRSGYMYNISDTFITTDTFKEGTGHTYPAGTNVYWTADGYWDCLAGTMVTSVNGQKGDITIDATSVGLGNVDNTADADKSVKHAATATSAVNANSAASATKLATARTIQTDLASTTAPLFDGTNNVSPGVKGILPLSHGGTGAATAVDARTNLGLGAAATYGVETSPVSGSGQLITSGGVYTALAGKSATGHTHDDRYYTETEVANLLLNKLSRADGVFTGDAYLNQYRLILAHGTYQTDWLGYLINNAGTTFLQGRNYLNLMSSNIQCRNNDDTAWAPIYASSYPGASARRYKDNVEPLSTEEAKKILDIEAVTFDYKKGIVIEKERYGKCGVIADDVANIIPSVVFYNETEDGETVIEGVDYSKFAPYLIKMVQIQQEEINTLKAELAEIKLQLV